MKKRTQREPTPRTLAQQLQSIETKATARFVDTATDAAKVDLQHVQNLRWQIENLSGRTDGEAKRILETATEQLSSLARKLANG